MTITAAETTKSAASRTVYLSIGGNFALSLFNMDSFFFSSFLLPCIVSDYVLWVRYLRLNLGCLLEMFLSVFVCVCVNEGYCNVCFQSICRAFSLILGMSLRSRAFVRRIDCVIFSLSQSSYQHNVLVYTYQ